MADIVEGKKEENVNRFLGDAVIGTNEGKQKMLYLRFKNEQEWLFPYLPE